MDQPTHSANRAHKDSFFRLMFNHAGRMCSLVNAVTGGRLRPEDIALNTLQGVFFGRLKNDVGALALGRTFIFTEHQSTVNANMPLRFLFYFARVLEETIDRDDMYRTGAVPIPKPYFYVLCNSPDMTEETRELRFSASFKAAGEQPDDTVTIELVVRVYNINYAPGRRILEECEPLRAYSLCESKIREGAAQGMPLGKAIERAMDYCIGNGVMPEFFNEHRKELNDMLDFEWDQNKALKARFDEGREQGREQGTLSVALEMLRSKLALPVILQCTKLSESALRSLAQAHGIAVA